MENRIYSVFKCPAKGKPNMPLTGKQKRSASIDNCDMLMCGFEL